MIFTYLISGTEEEIVVILLASKRENFYEELKKDIHEVKFTIRKIYFFKENI